MIRERGLRLFILTAILLGALAAGAEARPTLAVREFENKAGGDVPASAVTEMMTTELYEAGLFTLLEREKLKYVGEEIRLSQSGLMDESTAPELGKIKGAQYSMTGAVTEYHYKAAGGAIPIPGVGGIGGASNTAYVTLDIRIINNETGEVAYAAAERGASNQTLGGLITKYGGFGAGKINGILAAATRKAVMKHVESMGGLRLD
ncbi:CsgG/HfaB family protein [uncultured Fretibacterium sp.]|uniref:CsgG/HfaB family protein n=1 Tax=uncultured Fretibacterium sp. TaxID=1678694 RepID=UPI002616C647|nr:CsgG/HfaB family protein [uncultured Fretibacterium sp.]